MNRCRFLLLWILSLSLFACGCQNNTALPTDEGAAGIDSTASSCQPDGSFPATSPEQPWTTDSVTLSLSENLVSIPGSDSDPLTDETFSGAVPTLTKEEFFADALFIGDSRTVGLRDYAELETATFFAYSGLSSFSAFKKTLDVKDIGEITLETLLTTHPYGKIYVMLGINELGYPFSSIVSKYTQMIEQIRQLQPHATILLCANLRVVADGKETRDYIANETIDQLNAEIAALADGQTTFYIDANPLFDDGNGALDPRYCADDMHPYGKYYYQWAEWLYETGIPEKVNPDTLQ